MSMADVTIRCITIALSSSNNTAI